MIPNLSLWLADAPWIELLELLIDVTLKGAVICALACLATLLLRRSSAFTRNMIWVSALIGILLLPAFALVSPAWNLSVLPDLGSWGFGSYTPDYVKSEAEPFVGPLQPSALSGRNPAAGADAAQPLSLAWYTWAILAWIAGSFVYLCWCLISHAGVRYIVKKSRPPAPEWKLAFEGVARDLDLRRTVRLLESTQVKAAITVGIFDPAIVLPVSPEEWTEERRRLVLSHELAHVKRWDALVEILALAATVLYWFNPLVWFAVKQLRIERERDCDNAVLGMGARPSDYAELLMNIAADLGDSPRPVWQLSTISQSSNLKDRLMSILNQKINRKRGTRRSALLTGALALALLLPISTSGLWNVQAQEDSKKAQQAQMEKKKAKEEALKKAQMEEEHAKKKAQMEAEKNMSAEEKMKMKNAQKMSAEEKLKLTWEKICSNENSAACKVATVMKKDGIESGVKVFHKMKKPGAGDYLFDEKEFNTLGYMFLYNKKVDEAIAVFKLNVDEYPDSWNVYDSLGEALMVAGKYDKSKKYYEKALSMNPEAESAKKALQKLKEHTSQTS
jgi:beta-lactamase regulating signal transducer with metallopeptidase domain